MRALQESNAELECEYILEENSITQMSITIWNDASLTRNHQFTVHMTALDIILAQQFPLIVSVYIKKSERQRTCYAFQSYPCI